eukprot:360772-Chlamydomonas_euryale.AAC.8
MHACVPMSTRAPQRTQQAAWRRRQPQCTCMRAHTAAAAYTQLFALSLEALHQRDARPAAPKLMLHVQVPSLEVVADLWQRVGTKGSACGRGGGQGQAWSGGIGGRCGWAVWQHGVVGGVGEG